MLIVRRERFPQRSDLIDDLWSTAGVDHGLIVYRGTALGRALEVAFVVLMYVIWLVQMLIPAPARDSVQGDWQNHPRRQVARLGVRVRRLIR